MDATVGQDACCQCRVNLDLLVTEICLHSLRTLPPRSPLCCKNKLNLYHIEVFHVHALQLAISFIFLPSFPFQLPPHLVDLWSEESLWHPPRGPDAGSCDCLPPLWRCPPVTTATSASWLTCHDIRDLPPPFAIPCLFLIPSSFPLRLFLPSLYILWLSPSLSSNVSLCGFSVQIWVFLGTARLKVAFFSDCTYRDSIEACLFRYLLFFLSQSVCILPSPSYESRFIIKLFSWGEVTQHLFYNLSNQGAEKEPCGREKLQKDELSFSCVVRSMLYFHICWSSEDICICVFIFLWVLW